MAKIGSSNEKKEGFRFKEALIGGAITLLVSVVGGVLVWFFTKSPDRTERLIYRVDSPARFVSQGRSLVFTTLNIRNDGQQKAQSVVIEGDVTPSAQLIEKNISFSSGRATDFIDQSTPQKLRVIVPTFFPGDRVSIPILISGSAPNNFSVSVHSNEKMATRDKTGNLAPSGFVNIKTLIFAVMVTAFVGYSVNILIDYRRYKKKREQLNSLSRRSSFTPSKNNLGFLMMHNELLGEAEELFRKDIGTGDADLITIAHLAALEAIKENSDLSDKLFAAADWPTTDQHTRANISLDRFIAAASKRAFSEAEIHLLDAIRLSSDIIEYLENSKLIKRLVDECGVSARLKKEIAQLPPAEGK